MTTLSDHFDLTDAGAFMLVRPVSDAARAWMESQVGQPDHGTAYAVDHRYMSDLMFGAAADLLTWQ